MKKENTPQVLYHYTSGDGIRGILDGKAIWASSIQQLNDEKEYTHAIDLAIQALWQESKKKSDQHAQEFAHEAGLFLSNMSGLLIYVACFSEVEDSLSQWQGYCPPGLGYCVGFNSEKLAAVAEPQHFKLGKCIYDEEKKLRLINEWASDALDEMAKSLHKHQDVRACVHDGFGPWFLKFVEFAPFLKHHTFRHEKEWRLSGLIPVVSEKLRMRSGKSMLISYLPVDLPLTDPDPLISTIMVGPTPNIGLSVRAVSMYKSRVIIQNGISRSSVPYRSW